MKVDGGLMKVARRAAGLTGEEVARRINMTSQAVYGFESGKLRPGGDAARRLLMVLLAALDSDFDRVSAACRSVEELEADLRTMVLRVRAERLVDDLKRATGRGADDGAC